MYMRKIAKTMDKPDSAISETAHINRKIALLVVVFCSAEEGYTGTTLLLIREEFLNRFLSCPSKAASGQLRGW